MNEELKAAKAEAKALGIQTNNFKVVKDSTGEYSITQCGVCLAEGYNVTECRVYAIESLIATELSYEENDY